jgi:type VI protein secretion system component VasF
MSLAVELEEMIKIAIRAKLGLPIVRGKKDALSAGTLRDEVENAINRIVSRSSPGQVLQGRFPIEAFIDEVARHDKNLQSEWGKRPSLVDEHFSISVPHGQKSFHASAGSEVYRRIDALLQDGSNESVDILEVYCLCLQLGYDAGKTAEERNKYIENIKDSILKIRGAPNVAAQGLLSLLHEKPAPPAYDHTLRIVHGSTVGAIVGVALLWLLFFVYIDHRTSSLLRAIDSSLP